jgi:Rps23 Pro-64 3,4-dihydroxylase Tpa1-like proline 4-hydroxylase
VTERLVRVDLLLGGGHRQTLELPAGSPILRELLDAVVARLGRTGGPPPLFQIPIDEGRGALTFTGDQLVALATTPPVLAGTEDVVVRPAPGRPQAVPARYVRLHGVLGPEKKARLLEAAIARAPELVPSRVTTNVSGYRRSRLVGRPGELAADVVARVRDLLPELCGRLDVPPFPVGVTEAQLTLHVDGDYFRVHTDNGDEGTRAREISYIYYFHREPRRFTGGELVLYDGRGEDGQVAPVGLPIVIEPADDSLVVFPSGCLHEVRPVQLTSPDQADGRFTLNGWVRRADTPVPG